MYKERNKKMNKAPRNFYIQLATLILQKSKNENMKQRGIPTPQLPTDLQISTVEPSIEPQRLPLKQANQLPAWFPKSSKKEFNHAYL